MTFPLKIIGLLQRKGIPIPAGSIARWDGGSILDTSGSANVYDGTLSASPPTLTTGINGEADGAYNFVSANSQDITFPSIVEIVNVQQFTISTWMRRSSTGNVVAMGNFLDSTHGTALFMAGTNTSTPVRNGGVTQYNHPNTTINDWISIMTLWDGTQAVDADKISQYVDNVEVGSLGVPVPTFSANNSEPFTIGSFLTNFSDGDIAQTLIYDRILTSDERAQIYAQKT